MDDNFYIYGFPEEIKDYRNYNIDRDNMTEDMIKRLEAIHSTYKLQRTNCNYNQYDYMVEKYCTFNSLSNFWSLFYSLDNIVDLSDPDTSLPNSIHALQTAEAIRKKGYPDLFILCGLIHDMGKIIFLNGNDIDGTSKTTQWSIVGDTFITGCKIPDDIILPEYNTLNMDHISDAVSKYTINCGLENTKVSFGHDEYMYRILQANNHTMPKEAEYIIRYHSLYAWHRGTSYDYLTNDIDSSMKRVVQEFNKYDLYSKNDNNIIKWTTELKNYYTNLVKKYISQDLLIRY
jgi:inositol oxygenase